MKYEDITPGRWYLDMKLIDGRGTYTKILKLSGYKKVRYRDMVYCHKTNRRVGNKLMGWKESRSTAWTDGFVHINDGLNELLNKIETLEDV